MIFFYILIVILGLIILALGIEVLLKSFYSLNIYSFFLLLLFALFVSSIGIYRYLLSVKNIDYALFLIKLNNSLVYLISAVFFGFVNYFPRGERPVNAFKKISTVFIVSIIFSIISILGFDIKHYHFYFYYIHKYNEPYNISVIYNLTHYVMKLFSLIIILISIINLVYKYLKANLYYQKRQIIYFLSGFCIFCFINIIIIPFKNILPSSFYYFLEAFSWLIYSFIIHYTVINYRFYKFRSKFFDFLKELMIGCIVSIPSVYIMYIFKDWLASLSMPLYFTFVIIAFVVFFWIYEMLRNIIKLSLNMEYEKKDDTESIIDKISPSRNIIELGRNIKDYIYDNLNVSNVNFYYYLSAEDKYVEIDNEKEISAINPVFRYIKSDVDIYDREDIATNIKEVNRGMFENFFKETNSYIMFYLFFEKNIEAIITIGAKLDNNSFNNKELSLITKIKKISQATLTNLILFEKDKKAQLTKKDLLLASNIQDSLFPKVLPTFNKADFYAYIKPAKEVGGDYYYITKCEEDKAGVLIADVSGKGIPAAMIAMIIHTIAKTKDFSSEDMDSIVKTINDVLCQSQNNYNKIMSFATIFCASINFKKGVLKYCNAGHNPAILYDINNDEFVFLEANSKPAGIFHETNFKTESIKIKKNQILVLYSDGITESINEKEEEFGEKRLYDLIRKNKDKDVKTITETIINEVEEFSKDKEQFDDITIAVFKF